MALCKCVLIDWLNVILTKDAHTHNLTISIQNEKPGLGASYAIRPGNGVGLFYTPGPTQGSRWTQLKFKQLVLKGIHIQQQTKNAKFTPASKQWIEITYLVARMLIICNRIRFHQQTQCVPYLRTPAHGSCSSPTWQSETASATSPTLSSPAWQQKWTTV